MQGTTQAVPVSGRALGSPLGFYRRPSYSLQCDAGESMIYRHLQQYYGILVADELLVPVLVSPTRGKKVAPMTTARDFIGHPRRRGVCCSCISCSIALHKSSADQSGCEDHSNPRHPVVHRSTARRFHHLDIRTGRAPLIAINELLWAMRLRHIRCRGPKQGFLRQTTCGRKLWQDRGHALGSTCDEISDSSPHRCTILAEVRPDLAGHCQSG